MLPSRKKKEDPWWYSPTEFQIIATERAIRRCQLHPLLIQKIFVAMAKRRYPTRPKRAKRKWVELVCVDDVFYQLSCHVNEDMIVVTNISINKKVRKPKR
jgi:hypothetical protein